jgi:hypothetical protein
MSGDRPGGAAPPRPGVAGGRAVPTPRAAPGADAAAPRPAVADTDAAPQPSRGLLEQIALYVAAGATVLSLLMIAANTGIFLIDRAVQQQVNQRQQQINDGAQLNRVDQILVRALAMQAASAHDDTLRDLLNRNGVTFQLAPPAAKAAPAAGAAPAAAGAPAAAPATGAPATGKE